jgi:hypothetical protein
MADAPDSTADVPVTDEEIARTAREKHLASIRTAGPRARASVDDWLDKNVNQPAAAAGYPKVGAAISAAGSTAADLAIPENADEAGVLVPGKAAIGKVAKAAEEGAGPVIERVINYGRAPKRTITQATTGWEQKTTAELAAEAKARGLVK